MKTIVIGLLGIGLVQGVAAAQTPQEQSQILRAFQDSVEGYSSAATPAPRIFTLPVGTVFRQIIAKTLDEQVHVTHMTAVAPELPLDHHPAALEPFPDAELHEFPPVLARALPTLPAALDYRLIGNDLVIRDVGGHVIVAVLRDAVGQVVTTRR
ncbi:MAG: hypothetical protein WC815_10410 [Vicinamibacterales bacterium]|jgi:hypothetical protein